MELQNIDIILVEDNPDDVFMTLHAFQKEHLDKNVIVLIDGEEATDFFFHKKLIHDKQFNLSSRIILLDINLPKVNGIELLARLKQTPETTNIPVVMLTSSTEDPLVRQCQELGADEFIVKPVTLEDFTKVVHSLRHYWE